MPAADTRLDLARHFASALDRSDFNEAARYLAPGCRYEIDGKVITGVQAILAAYGESAQWGREHLDSVTYESEVVPAPGGALVTYIDRITHQGESFEHRSRQRLWLDEAGRITRIVHEELPGEHERLQAFFDRHGLRR